MVARAGQAGGRCERWEGWVRGGAEGKGEEGPAVLTPGTINVGTTHAAYAAHTTSDTKFKI